MNRWLKRALWGIGGAGLFVGSFGIGLWLTFPEQKAADFVRWQIQTNSDYVMMLDQANPYWLGARLDNVSLYSVKKNRRPQGRPKTNLILQAESLKTWVNPLSALSLAFGRSGTIHGRMTREGGDFDISATVSREQEAVSIHALKVEGDDLPLALIPIPNAKLIGTGGLDLDVDLLADQGFSKADGTISLTAAAMTIDKIESEALAGMDPGAMQINNVDLQMDVKGGKAKIERGQITGRLASFETGGEMNAEVEGDIVLMDNLPNSRLRLKFIISVGESILPLARAAMKDAEWADGKFHYALTGTFGNPKFRAERERRGRSSALERSRPNRTAQDAGGEEDISGPKPVNSTEPVRVPREFGPLGMPGMRNGTLGPDERQKDREATMAERRERLAERRRLREAAEMDGQKPRYIEDDEPGFEPGMEEMPPEELPFEE